jgi:pre-mRNA-processing factor 6
VQIWLAAAKLEWESNEIERARAVLQRARARAPSDRVFMKSVLLERECGNKSAEQELLTEALKRYPSAPKLWMMAGQLAEDQGNIAGARGLYQRGTKLCPTSIPLWKLAARLEVWCCV